VRIDSRDSARHASSRTTFPRDRTGTLQLPDGRCPSDPQSIEIAHGRVYSVQNIEIPEDDRSSRADRFREGWVKKDKPYVEETNLISFADPLASS